MIANPQEYQARIVADEKQSQVSPVQRITHGGAESVHWRAWNSLQPVDVKA
jgi:hypothetical protein